MLYQMTYFNQISKVHLQCVATGAGQPDGFAYRYAAMFTGKLDDLQGEVGQG